MPGKDGLETAREIRARVGEHVPIIILSAYDWSAIEEEARKAGIQAFVEKPLFRSRLVYALHSVLAQNSEPPQMVSEEPKETRYEDRRILLAEDNELNREIAGELLEFIGVEVEQAEDGSIAAEMMEKSPPGYYDLIFMDIQMPVLNGYDATRRIRSLPREDAMTANAFADDVREAMESGMNDHMSKPVEMEKLMEALDQWLPPRVGEAPAREQTGGNP